MKAKLTIDGKEFEVEISEEQAKTLTETKKKTGYERVQKGDFFYVGRNYGTADFFIEDCKAFEDKYYKCADYHSDKTVAENNARADMLDRQLRRFAVEHREFDNNWDGRRDHSFITFDTDASEIVIDYNDVYKGFSTIYFDSKKAAQLAIDTFKNELLWYFTEYKDSL